MNKKNWFDSQGQQYADFRPGYPKALFDWVASTAKHHKRLWDCATGNGQAACALAEYFETIVATDSAASQIQAATPHPQVHYHVASADQSGLADDSVDCITIAQALHWFANEGFFNEARRVATPGASIIAWTYATARFEDRHIDTAWKQCYEEYLQPYFPPGREHVEDAYTTIAFPFDPKQTNTFRQPYRWTLPRFLQYISTMSAVKHYTQTHSINPITAWIEPRLRESCSDREAVLGIYFDITALQGHIK